MADLSQTRPTPLHPGVDAQSWLGFEQRIQARRFEALVASARHALSHGNVVLAQHAVDEARDIQPRAGVLHELEAEIARLSKAADGRPYWRRAGGAVVWLAAGVLLFMALDQTRILPHSVPQITPPPPQLLSAISTVRQAEPLASFAEVVSVDAPAVEGEVDAPTDAPGIRVAADRRPVERNGGGQRSGEARLRTVESGATGPAANGDDATPAPADATPAPGVSNHQVRDDAADESSSGTMAQDSSILDHVGRAVFGPAAPIAAAAVVTRRPAIVSAAVVDRSAEDASRVADVLRQYARAYDRLDVSAATEVWPSVDRRALARAFDGLASQTVSFDDCQIDVRGALANASCRGRASYVGKVGRRAPRTEPRTWRFELRRDGDTWKISTAEARLTSG